MAFCRGILEKGCQGPRPRAEGVRGCSDAPIRAGRLACTAAPRLATPHAEGRTPVTLYDRKRKWPIATSNPAEVRKSAKAWRRRGQDDAAVPTAHAARAGRGTRTLHQGTEMEMQLGLLVFSRAVRQVQDPI